MNSKSLNLISQINYKTAHDYYSLKHCTCVVNDLNRHNNKKKTSLKITITLTHTGYFEPLTNNVQLMLFQSYIEITSYKI